VGALGGVGDAGAAGEDVPDEGEFAVDVAVDGEPAD